jgi:Uma2 family endonuclease
VLRGARMSVVPASLDPTAIARNLQLLEIPPGRRCAVSELADLPRGLITLEQWDALRLDPTRRWELSEGSLIMSPRPVLRHQRISRRLTRLLEDHLPEGLEAVPEIEVITKASFPPSVRDPDVVVVHDRVFAQRSARVAASDVVLVVEIVSPGSRGMDHVMKLHEYAKAGIPNYWIVDPDAPTHDRFLAYLLDGERYRRVSVLDGSRVRVHEPTEMEFTLDLLTGD